MDGLAENFLPPSVLEYRFRERARNLLQGWVPMLLEDLPNHFWRLSELETLTYVPKDDRKHFCTIFGV